MKRLIKVGNCYIGGDAPISIQSMTNTVTEDVQSTITQINELKKVGCDIVRCAVNTKEAAEALKIITKQTTLPIVADIHYDYKLAILSAKNGAAKIRINPSNIGSQQKVSEIVAAAKDLGLPIRVGVNGGSIDSDIYSKYGHSGKALAACAIRQVSYLEKNNFFDIVISAKSSDSRVCYDAYNQLHTLVDYPLHIGLTEAGVGGLAIAKSNIVIGALLLNNIGDTIRVSLSENPSEEVVLAKNILQALGIRKNFVEIIACPTCARTEFDVIKVSKTLQERVKDIKKNIKIAVMGCTVNGIGEGKEADFGVAGGKDKSIIFKNGRQLKVIPNDKVLDCLLEMIEE